MPDIIQQTFRDAPLLQQWYSWGVIVGFFFALGATLWLFVDAQRNNRDEVLWKSVAAVATVLAIPALLARLHGGFAWEMRDSLSLVAYLSMLAVVLAGVATIAYAMGAPRGRVCEICGQIQQPGWVVCPNHPGFGPGVGTAGVPPINSPFTPITDAGTSDSGDGGRPLKETIVKPRGGNQGRSGGNRRTVVIAEEERPRALGLLLVTSGEHAGTKLDLIDGKTTIGASGDCDHMIDDDAVSSIHISIRFDREETAFIVTDLDAQNGTYVNDERIHQCTLRNNDIVRIGRTQMQFIQVTAVKDVNDSPTRSSQRR